MSCELLQVLFVFGLTCNCSQGFMSNDILFVFIFNALTEELFLFTLPKTNLSQNEADFMFE